MIRTRTMIGAALGAALSMSGAAQAQDAYVNLFAGMAVFDSTITVGGVKLVDQGGDAPMAGGRLGWGRALASGIYLGAEAEGFGAWGRSRAVIRGEGYSWALHGGAGAFGRIGWAAPSGAALFFARAGGMALFTNDGTQAVPAVGIGAEVRISGRWFARVDLGYAWNDRELYTGTAGVGVRF